MEEEKNKKKMILAIIGAIILVAGIVGLTIAYFRAQAESKDIVVSSKKLSIVFSDPEGSLIRASDIEPIADEDIDTLGTKKTFTIAKKDAADKDVYLRLELTDLVVSDNFKDSDLRWALYKSGSIVTEGSFVNVKSSTSLPLANNILLDSTTPEEYNLYIWIHETGVDQERLMGGSLSGKITVTGTENTQEGIVNEGKLAEGMIPVVYDETNNTWVKAGGDLGWYDYSKQEWANMILTKEASHECEIWDGIKGDVNKDGDITLEDCDLINQKILGNDTTGLTEEEWLQRADIRNDGNIDSTDITALFQYIIGAKPLCEKAITSKSRQAYLEASPGTFIETNDINDFYTWIPRYKYRINNTGSVALPSMIDVEFENGTTSTGVSINTSGVAKTEYYTHPAFRDGSKVYKTTAYDQSGWDKELSGFWVAKFQVNNETQHFSPNKVILENNRSSKISPLYNIDLTTNEVTNMFLSSTVETHSMKNTEWGAIAYLSQSKYGKMGNSNYTGANKEIYINSSADFITGRSAGVVSGSNVSTVDKESYSYDGFSCNSQFLKKCKGTKDMLKGTGASTTGNIYGIYDMIGSKNEFVMANYNNSLASSGFTADFFTDSANKKYYDSYNPDKTYILGDATEETKGWYNDASGIFDTDNPFLVRGGVATDGSSAGIFSYKASDGAASESNSIRIVAIL